ncbi:MAG: hypothetical protein PHY73_00320 [Candidatus Omnitrophica bacterium]|nr:hypothetical protein [Candidatus Omnitrophota bacterium]
MFKKILYYQKTIGLAVFLSVVFLCLDYLIIYFSPFIQNIFPLLFISCLIVAIFALSLARQENLAAHLFVLTLSLTVFFSFLSIVVNILMEPFFDWNSARLAWTFSIKYGHQVFYGLSKGPILARMYGPLMPLSYWPCTWMKTPTLAICLGSLLSVLFIFVPSISFFVIEAKKESFSKSAFFCYFSLFCLFSFSLYSLSRSIFMIHADAPSIGLAALACLFLYGDREELRPHYKILSAFFVACSIWTKQIAVPLAIALPMYVWVKEGRRSAQSYFFQIILFLFSLLALFSYSFGFREMFEEMFLIPSRHPARYSMGWGKGFFLIAWYFLKNTSLFVALILLTNIEPIKRLFKRAVSFNVFFKQNDWVLFFLVGVAMAPTAILAMLKKGGDVNNFSFSIYFFVLAATICLVRFFLKSLKEVSLDRKKIIKFLFCILMFCLMSLSVGTFFSFFNRLILADRNPQEMAYVFSLQNPEKIYFPDSILSTCFSDKKVYHSLDGVYDRKNARIPIDPQHFKKYIPRKLEQIAIPKRYLYRHSYILEKFPEFHAQKGTKETAFWTVYEKK